jgi:hypothetical protein
LPLQMANLPYLLFAKMIPSYGLLSRSDRAG